MKPEDVGTLRFCPACGRAVMDSYEEVEDENIDWDNVYCSCCKRPWHACPCTPVSEGECKSISIDL